MSPPASKITPSAFESPMKHDFGPNSFENYLVVLKVHWDSIQIGPIEEMKKLVKTHSFKIYCQQLTNGNLDEPPGENTTSIKVFVFNSDINDNSDTSLCEFIQQQPPHGHPIQDGNIVTFMTPPSENKNSSNYGISLSYAKKFFNSCEQDKADKETRKLGTAYLSLDPKFSTQGCQKIQLIGTYSKVPVGHLRVEYLIVRNPVAYGVKVPRPTWLSKLLQLDAGHRGSGSGCRPDLSESITENTLASFNYAARHGADMCELDVMCTADGIPIIFHNYTVETGNPNRNQIEQLTLSELRALTDFRLHDKDCKHKNIKSIESHRQMEEQQREEREKQEKQTVIKPIRKSSTLQYLSDDLDHSKNKNTRMFPTLEEVLCDVDQTCALNIELKWPQLLNNGQSEAKQFREINDNVDRILKCIFDHARGRAIMLSTFHSDIAILLRLKQAVYPVLFLTTGDSSRFHDPITKSVKNAIHFAQAFDLAGINPNASKVTGNLVKYAQDRGQLVYAWGKIESPQAIKELKQTGLNGVIYDKIDLIKPGKEN